MGFWNFVLPWCHNCRIKLSSVIEKLKSIIDRRVPIVGRLVYCDFDDHWNAIGEVTNYVVWAAMPFWLGALVLLLTDNAAPKNFVLYWHLLISTFDKGELLIFSTALLAPAFSVALTDPKNQDAAPFPGKLSHATVVAILMVICAALYSVQRTNHNVDPHILFQLSVTASIISFFFFYLASLYHHNRINPSEKIRQDEVSFADRYDSHRMTP